MSENIDYRSLFERSFSAFSVHSVILDEAGKPVDYIFLQVNAAFERFTGLRREEILGKSVLTVLPGTEPIWIEKFGQVAITGVPANFESFSGELGKWFQVTAFQHEPMCFTASFVDITERVLEHERALAAEAKYRSFFDTGAIKLVVDPAEGKIVEANLAASDFYGYSVQEMAGMSVSQINPMSKDEYLKAMNEAKSNERNFFPFRHRLANGQVRDVDIYSNPGQWNGREALFSNIFDVTELRILKKRAEQSERLAAIGSMTASINHEFGNLLSILGSQFQLVKMMFDDSEAAKKLNENIQKQFERSRRLIDSIKRLSKAQQLKREHYRISRVLSDIVELGQPLCRERGIKVVFNETERDIAELDVALIQQVFLNIIKNAVQSFTNEANPRITIEARDCGSEVVVRIGNNGPPILPEVRPKLFTPFFTTRANLEEPGSGLGLSFSASVISAHGGVLFLEDSEETTFQVRLPKAESMIGTVSPGRFEV